MRNDTGLPLRGIEPVSERPKRGAFSRNDRFDRHADPDPAVEQDRKTHAHLKDIAERRGSLPPASMFVPLPEQWRA